MELKDLLFLLADVWMIFAGFTFGIKFIRRYGNYLLGLEWIIVATSGSNFLVYAVVGADENSFMYTVAYFFDQFSRSVGITLILVMGLMRVTHRYKPSVGTDVGVFAFAAAVGLSLLLFGERLGVGVAVSLIVVNVLTTLFLIYFMRRLWAIGAKGWSVGTALATAAACVIAATYDFVHIPGDDAAHTLFYVGALSTWGFQLFTYYFAYRALHNHNESAATEPDLGEQSRVDA
ncbi:transporter [Streptomyces solicathayae]|uniref:Transporter n=1 Tax=Streptomyces solicathayae TaxID=3081768 RepID=A0ABZ0LQ35_9ACTN|nr:transporter [Streptomyces sp. HUAS YS2]WOX21609.1 transporter [Streptomyces sp. HUAS YS2]